MGLIIHPATEADRCRLAAYFTNLVDGDEATLCWTQAFAAEDKVKKVVVAAEQGVTLINTADTPGCKLPSRIVGLHFLW